MILNMDKIQFESRAEIVTIIKALEDWQVVNALQARETSFPDLQPPYG